MKNLLLVNAFWALLLEFASKFGLDDASFEVLTYFCQGSNKNTKILFLRKHQNVVGYKGCAKWEFKEEGIKANIL